MKLALPALVGLLLLAPLASPEAAPTPRQPCMLSTSQDLGAVSLTSGGLGCEVWSATSAEAQAAILPVTVGDVVAYVATSSGLHGVDAATGDTLWARHPTDHGFFHLIGDRARDRFLTTGAARGAEAGAAAWAWDAGSGALLWRSSTSGPGTWGNAIALSSDGAFVAIAGDGGSYGTGLIRVLDAATGASVWERRVPLGVSGNFDWAGFSQDGSTLFAGGSFGPDHYHYHAHVAAFELSSGDKLWDAAYGEPGETSKQLGAARVVGSDLIVVSDPFLDGASHVTYVEGENGAVRWRFLGDELGGAWRMLVELDGDVVWVYLSGARVNLRAIQLASGGVTRFGMAPLYAEDFELEPVSRTLLVTGGPCCGSVGFGTTALDADTLTQRWYARYVHPTLPHNAARGIAVEEGGSRVFVAGFAGEGDFFVRAVEAVLAAYAVDPPLLG